jgi:CubicO group peptidase (beta-lactamase class C family)
MMFIPWWGRRWPGTVWAGAAVAVVRPGAPRAVDCIGVAHTRTARLVEADTVFRIASVTKTMTAIGLMQLRESGRFGLDDPVNEYLKSFRIESPPGWPDVTFRHLLTHTTGIGQIPRLSDVVHPAAFGIDEPGSGGVDLATLYRGALRPEIPAGRKWVFGRRRSPRCGRPSSALTPGSQGWGSHSSCTTSTATGCATGREAPLRG